MSVNPDIIAQAAFFHPAGFLLKSGGMAGAMVMEGIQAGMAAGSVAALENAGALLYYQALPWDSAYFGIPTFRVELMGCTLSRQAAVLAGEDLLERLRAEISSRHENYYILAEIPAEAIHIVQAMCRARWRMLETRVTYYHDDIANFSFPRRFPVRQATLDDIPGLRAVAAAARNDFDRFHADGFFPVDVADAYLATFVDNSIRGFADVTLVPDLGERAAGAFLTANYVPPCAAFAGRKLARMVLSAVGAERQGWYVKLVAEMSYFLKAHQVEVCYMTTQATNRAVIRTWEKLGYAYGRTSHLFVMSAGAPDVA